MTATIECAKCHATIAGHDPYQVSLESYKLDSTGQVGPLIAYCDHCLPATPTPDWHHTARHFATATQSWLDARRTLRVLRAIGTDRSIPGADLAANLEATDPRR